MDWISIYSTEEDIWNIIYVNPLFWSEHILKSLYLRIFAEMGTSMHSWFREQIKLRNVIFCSKTYLKFGGELQNGSVQQTNMKNCSHALFVIFAS